MSRAHHANQLGGHSFNHEPSSSTEAEYDRLRDLAREEHSKMQSCFDHAHRAYDSGNGGEAHEYSQEGKEHQERMNQYNRQASEFIFRENNAVDRVASDTIDLHGQFVEEAEHILQERIRAAKAQNQTHLHVIVGKGNHSPGHIQKIKPMVEQTCQELGLQYATEPNAGRIYVNLQGGSAEMPPAHTWGDAYNQGGRYGSRPPQHQAYTPQQQPQYQQQGQVGAGNKPQQQFEYDDQQQQQQQQQQQRQDPITACLRSCCTIM